MKTTRYKSDAIYKDAVMKYFLFAFVATLPVIVPSGIVLIIHGDVFGDRLKWAILILPATQLIAWLVLGTVMCLIFQAMVERADGRQPPPPHRNPDYEIHWQPTGKGDYVAKVVAGQGKNGKP